MLLHSIWVQNYFVKLFSCKHWLKTDVSLISILFNNNGFIGKFQEKHHRPLQLVNKTIITEQHLTKKLKHLTSWINNSKTNFNKIIKINPNHNKQPQDHHNNLKKTTTIHAQRSQLHQEHTNRRITILSNMFSKIQKTRHDLNVYMQTLLLRSMSPLIHQH